MGEQRRKYKIGTVSERLGLWSTAALRLAYILRLGRVKADSMRPQNFQLSRMDEK